jgi:hypothetical protein
MLVLLSTLLTTRVYLLLVLFFEGVRARVRSSSYWIKEDCLLPKLYPRAESAFSSARTKALSEGHLVGRKKSTFSSLEFRKKAAFEEIKTLA